jgi:hypothetical protein
LGERTTSHLRHDHKYGSIGVDPARRFHFRTTPDNLTGAVAANLAQLEGELARCDRGVLRHHCPKGDFSRWIAEVLRDEVFLAEQIATLETAVSPSSPAAVVDEERVHIIAVLQTARPRPPLSGSPE